MAVYWIVSTACCSCCRSRDALFNLDGFLCQCPVVHEPAQRPSWERSTIKARAVRGRGRRGAQATRGVAVLGSTGSIGTTALRVLDRQRGAFRVEALTAYENATLLEEQARAFGPPYVGLVVDGQRPHPAGLGDRRRLPGSCMRRSTGVDIVLNAVVGAAGLDATLAGLRAGKRVALANKETLVVAGELVAAAAVGRRRRGRARRQRALGHSAVHWPSTRVGGPSTFADRVGRTIPRLVTRTLREGHGRRRAETPDVANGSEDHGR